MRNAIKILKNNRGATLLENTIALPLLLMCLIVTLELLRISYVKLSMHYVLRETARHAMIYPTTEVNFKSKIKDRLDVFGISFDTAASDSLTVCPTGSSCTAGSVNMGKREDFMKFHLSKQTNLLFVPPSVPSVFGKTVFSLTAEVIGRNEPP